MTEHHKEPGILKLTVALGLITGVAGVILGLVATGTMPLADANEKRMQEEARREVLPEAKSFEVMPVAEAPKEGEATPERFIGKDAEGKTVGYVVNAVGKGYGGEIKVVLGIDSSYKVVAYRITGHNETPGLGDGALKPKFKDQFKGKTPEQLEVVKRPDGGKILAITGATITSRAVTKTVKDALESLQLAKMSKSETMPKLQFDLSKFRKTLRPAYIPPRPQGQP